MDPRSDDYAEQPTEDINDSERVEDEDIENEEEEEEVEPIVKYSRFSGNSVPDIMKQFTITCSENHEKFMVIGTHLGVVFVVDYCGEEVKRFVYHTDAVLDISIDETGEFIATCGADGMLFVQSMFASTPPIKLSSSAPIRSVCLEPQFAKSSKKIIAYHGANDSLLLSLAGWFGRKDKLLCSGEGPILNIKWFETMIAWATKLGVKVFNTQTETPVTFVPKPEHVDIDQHPCSLVWDTTERLWIAWGQSIFRLQIPRSAEANGRGATVDISFTLPYYICGISLFQNMLMLLAFNESEATDAQPATPEHPELVILDYANNFEEKSNDAIPIYQFELNKCNSYRIGRAPGDEMYFIVSPKDIIVCRPCDIDDRINWLVEHNKFDEALALARENQTNRLPDISNKYLQYLFDCNDIQKAIDLCKTLLSDDRDLWHTWWPKFKSANKILQIATFIPIFPALKQEIYEDALMACLEQQDYDLLRKLVAKWPYHLYPNLYDISKIIGCIREALSHDQTDVVRDKLQGILAKLLEEQKRAQNQ